MPCRRLCSSTAQVSFSSASLLDQARTDGIGRSLLLFLIWACSSFKTLVAEASAEETAAKEASDAKAEAEAAAAAKEAEAKRQEAARQAKLDAAKSMEVTFLCVSPIQCCMPALI